MKIFFIADVKNDCVIYIMHISNDYFSEKLFRKKAKSYIILQ